MLRGHRGLGATPASPPGCLPPRSDPGQPAGSAGVGWGAGPQERNPETSPGTVLGRRWVAEARNTSRKTHQDVYGSAQPLQQPPSCNLEQAGGERACASVSAFGEGTALSAPGGGLVMLEGRTRRHPPHTLRHAESHVSANRHLYGSPWGDLPGQGQGQRHGGECGAAGRGGGEHGKVRESEGDSDGELGDLCGRSTCPFIV